MISSAFLVSAFASKEHSYRDFLKYEVELLGLMASTGMFAIDIKNPSMGDFL